jgi:hypothetical protein
MTPTRLLLLALVAFSLLWSFPGNARAGFAIDTFTYDPTPPEIVGQNGGTGFAGAWQGNTGTSGVQGNQLLLTGNNDNSAFRSLAESVSQTVYFSFTVRFTGGLLDSGDFLSLWFDNPSPTTGVITGTHTTVPNVGIRDNGTSDFYARLALPSTGPPGAFLARNLVEGETYLLVGRLGKSGGVGAAFDSIQLWVNPMSEADLPVTDLPPPTTNLTSFNTIGFRTATLDAGDQIFIDNLQLGNTFESVQPTPAPGGLVLALSAAPLFFALRRRLRKPDADAATAA